MPNQRKAQIEKGNHQLVSARFLTPVDGVNMDTHHLNGVRWDNRVVNLQIVPHDLNVAYARGMPIVARCVRGDGGFRRYVSIASCCRAFAFRAREHFIERLVLFNFLVPIFRIFGQVFFDSQRYIYSNLWLSKRTCPKILKIGKITKFDKCCGLQPSRLFGLGYLGLNQFNSNET
jgi:hypothetical protein